MALTGCVSCGLVVEAETELGPGHLTSDLCRDCGATLRVIDLAEANKLTEERFLAGHWRELIALASPKRAGRASVVREPGPDDANRRRSVLKRERLDSDPRQLRASLAELDGLLKGLEPDLRRRVYLTFSELVARWQDEFAGDEISATVELLPGAIRVAFENAERVLTSGDWEALVSVPIVSLVDDWGLDRRGTGSAWFEFRPGKESLS